MDSYDDDIQRQQYHPSHSIPDAAYPDDSPFRHQQQQQQHHFQAPYSTGGFGANTVHRPPAAVTPLSSHAGGPSGYQPQHQHQTQNQEAWQPYDIPSSPPPPYDPSQAPGAYQYPSIHAPAVATPAATYPTAPVDGHVPTVGIELMPLPPQQTAPLAPIVSTSALTHASNIAEDPDKLDAASTERVRRQRRLKICIIILTVVFIFCGALIMGIAWGVFKRSIKHPDDPDDHDVPI
ncbi:uncharacterized protein TRIREDRAFT_106111 [Trichoderma reesei QM6a]|uniref:Predicted protein n=2 Tax=Hypocrea jecorina TaxID=51453 RepID=G0RGC7_HYPJQ|nr:uncharacterized protein TRIREDRAFT_106111 [Trichoderma reesei QM6a]EGR50022.1 predicted protein [Trichoderma reesei QM6a]ETS03496.1 hypothetical protein M419DRAFT_128783 [Trichoderma reesei RUT C-30]